MSAIDHHDDHADEPRLQHHWNNSGQQFEAGKLGMWLFLATEFLLFAGLFCAYAVYRSNHPELFEYGAKFLDWKLGATNTAVLIASSFTMAWAVTAAQRGQVKLMNGLLFITFFGGVGFLGIKYIEYTSKFKDNIYWGTALYEEVEGVTHDLTVTEEAVGDDGVMVETRFDLPAPQPENLSAVAEAPAGPGGLSAGGLASSILSKPMPTKTTTLMTMTIMTITRTVTMDMMLVMGGMTTTPTTRILAWIPNVLPTPTSTLAFTTP